MKNDLKDLGLGKEETRKALNLEDVAGSRYTKPQKSLKETLNEMSAMCIGFSMVIIFSVGLYTVIKGILNLF